MSGLTATTAREPVHVALGIARNSAQEVLIARRPAGKVRSGQWEFPGGKLDRSESAADALIREWSEELAVAIEVDGEPYTLTHHYPDATVVLHVFERIRLLGDPHPREGQEIRWAAVEALDVSTFVAGDRYVVTRLQLPRRYLLSNARELGVQDWLARVDPVLARHPAMVQLREHDLPDAVYAPLAADLELRCRRHHAPLLFNRALSWVSGRASGGLHLPARVLEVLTERPVPRPRLIGASCHNLAQLRKAEALDLDFATLSPVQPTVSHPGVVGMGWSAFEALARAVAIPVFAQGGLGEGDLGLARRHGAHGVAMLRAPWR